jgi:hypothetical protein
MRILHKMVSLFLEYAAEIAMKQSGRVSSALTHTDH